MKKHKLLYIATIFALCLPHISSAGWSLGIQGGYEYHLNNDLNLSEYTNADSNVQIILKDVVLGVKNGHGFIGGAYIGKTFFSIFEVNGEFGYAKSLQQKGSGKDTLYTDSTNTAVSQNLDTQDKKMFTRKSFHCLINGRINLNIPAVNMVLYLGTGVGISNTKLNFEDNNIAGDVYSMDPATGKVDTAKQVPLNKLLQNDKEFGENTHGIYHMTVGMGKKILHIVEINAGYRQLHNISGDSFKKSSSQLKADLTKHLFLTEIRINIL